MVSKLSNAKTLFMYDFFLHMANVGWVKSEEIKCDIFKGEWATQGDLDFSALLNDFKGWHLSIKKLRKSMMYTPGLFSHHRLNGYMTAI